MVRGRNAGWQGRSLGSARCRLVEAGGASVEDQQFERLMKAVDSSNAQLRSISLSIAVLAVLAVAGLGIGFIAWVASIS